MSKVIHGGKVASVVSALREAIKHRRYVPGQRLVEADLTTELGVSRSLLREAFRILSSEGMVETVPNRGAVVKRLSLTEAMELFQIRMELESLAARLAAENCRDLEVRARFETDIAELWDTAPRLSTSAYLSENEGFHAAVFRASANGQLRLLNRQLQLSLIMAQIASSLTHHEIAQSIEEHRSIVRAVLAGDVAAADAASRAHLARARAFVAAMPSDVFRQTEPG